MHPISASAGVCPTGQPQNQSGWVLTWGDEFNAAANTGVDTGDWLYDTGTGYACPGCPANWGTGEVESMSDSTANVYHDGAGHLAIKPLHTSSSATAGWTSGRIETQRTDFQPPAGGAMAVEASLQQPDVAGAAAAGYWPALWMLGTPFRGNYLNWPRVGEIDIMEGVNGSSYELGTLHCGTSPGGPCNEYTGLSSGPVSCPGCQSAFHTYRVELDASVSPEQIRWYLDGVNFFTVCSDQVDATTWADATDHGFFIIIDVAMGGGLPAAFGGGPTASTTSGIPMLIDYVRVYTRVSETPSPTPVASTTATPTPETRCVLDVDGIGTPPADVATDVVYAARTLLGLNPVPPSWRVLDPSIPPDATIVGNVGAIGMGLDVDTNGHVDVATDIVYIARRLLGLPPVPARFRMLDRSIADDASVAASVDALCP